MAIDVDAAHIWQQRLHKGFRMRKIGSVFLVALAFCMPANSELVFEQFRYDGRAVPFYNDSSKPEQQEILDGIKAVHLAELMATLANESLKMKKDIGVGFESCGQVNSFFDPRRGAVVICSEFVAMVLKMALSDSDHLGKLTKEQFGKVINGLIWGVFFHEFGHAIIHTNSISITGREEDVADQFAVWYALNFVDLKQHPVIGPTIWFWGKLAKERNIPSMTEQERRNLMSNEHSLDEQRIYNMACWALGVGTEAGARTARFAGLPSERAQRCPSEYAQVDLGMKSHFKKYFKVRPLSGAW